MSQSKFMAVVAVAALAAGATVARAGVIEDFEDGDVAEYIAVGGGIGTTVSGAHAHDGSYGLGVSPGNLGWIYRDDAQVQVAQGQTLSVWVRFDQVADARAYFGFGASSAGTLSFVLAPNTGDIRFQENPSYSYTELSSSAQTFTADQWYRAEVVWGAGGSLVGNLYGSDGTTLLNSVSANSSLYSSGGIAFRGFDGVKSFDTVSTTSVVPVPPAAGLGLALLGGLGLMRMRKRRGA